ncbi:MULTISPECIES: class I SAM-dependent methyltransferase [unclassified Fusibacter]|uniref:class I SAM-dependent methyltransferase n=1 Tax=unclassified Fusibacter TaxID=2624464 RepID=UPI00101114A9|nr:class I SAM-dependent methyltransferase [Fusibacter sp. A1]MCK8058159.1 class I SAM-dependent methyltransferase [Fusibacter sp. A2]NPE20742.1 class I SAM-dependent methyltransferase [Fusibacter sp. A1]RXV62949.1 class I SAM-dependent methyltransferase [Fusibacter sp. A1]
MDNRSVWDKVAANYGSVGPKYWNWFGEQLVSYSAVQEGMKVLDIGFGRGASLFPAASIVGDSGKVEGIDTSAEMVAHTQNEVLANQLRNIDVFHSSLEDYCENTGGFDRIMCGFGIGYLSASDDNFKILHKSLKEEGVLSLSVWTHQEDQSWLTSVVNKHLGITDTPDHASEEKDEEEEYDLCTATGLKSFIESQGFSHVETEIVEKTFVFSDQEEWWADLNSSAVKNIIDVIDGMNCLDAFKKDAFDGILQFKKNDGIHIRREAILVRGTK